MTFLFDGGLQVSDDFASEEKQSPRTQMNFLVNETASAVKLPRRFISSLTSESLSFIIVGG